MSDICGTESNLLQDTFARYHTERFIGISAKLLIWNYCIRGFHDFVLVVVVKWYVNNYFLIQ